MEVALLPFTTENAGPRIGRLFSACALCLALMALLTMSSGIAEGTRPTGAGLNATPGPAAIPIHTLDRTGPQISVLPDDWPQLQRDSQHTGYSPQEVRPPYRYYWRWNEAPFASRTQPVVAAGTLYIGSLNGRMYALDADQDANGGPPTVLWVQDVGSAIRHTASVYSGCVYFGAQDGRFYALDAATGALKWTFLTGGAIVSSPVAGNGAVYIGSSDGSFYALDAAGGQVRWSYLVGAPILTSAALSADEKTVYIGAENLYAYALNADTGTLIWNTRLQGQSLADRWPVVVGGNVIYRSQSLHYFHLLLQEGDDAMDLAGAVRADWSADWAVVRPRIVTYLTANRDSQTFFVLNATTGALRGPAPVLYTYGNADAPDPPVAKDGLLYLRYRARHGIQTDGGSGHVTTRYDAELGRMNLATLDITGLRASQPFNYQFRSTSDEPSMLSIGGNLLYVDSWERLGALDLQTGALTSIANVADDWMACPPSSTPPSPPASGGQCPIRGGPLPFFQVPWPFPGPQVGEGFVHRSLVIAAGRLLWRVENGGLASIGHTLQGATQPETASSAPASDITYVAPAPDIPTATAVTSVDLGALSTPQTLSSYVWAEPTRPVANPPADLVEQLAYQVQQLVNANAHLLPFLLERGFTTLETYPTDPLTPEDGIVECRPGNTYWFDPGELVYTLSIAYPYLSSDLQTKVRAYLAAEMGRYPPLDRMADDWLTHGVRRETYAVTIQPNCWPLPVPSITTLYALWAYARYTGDWQYVQDRWPGISALFGAKKGAVDTYASISGAIGYARIAQHLNRLDQANEGQRVAVDAMTAGLDFGSFLSAANSLHPDPRDRYTGLRAPVFFGLTPEVGRYVSDTNRTAAMAYLNDLTAQDGVFLWYLTRLGIQAELGESSFHGPDLAWSVFLAKAYVEGASRPILRSNLDRPWGLGDLYHIQKLVATIEASGTADTTPPVTSDVTFGNITFHSARINWTTDEPASGQVEYGPTAAYGSASLLQPGLVTSHTIVLTGLRPSRLYHFRVCSTSSGGKSCSADRTLTTAMGREVFVPTVARSR